MLLLTKLVTRLLASEARLVLDALFRRATLILVVRGIGQLRHNATSLFSLTEPIAMRLIVLRVLPTLMPIELHYFIVTL